MLHAIYGMLCIGPALPYRFQLSDKTLASFDSVNCKRNGQAKTIQEIEKCSKITRKNSNKCEKDDEEHKWQMNEGRKRAVVVSEGMRTTGCSEIEKDTDKNSK